MALTQTAEYALRAVVWLAQHADEPQTKAQIAKATQVPSSYLPKVVQPLIKGKLIRAQRGVGGGYQLAKDPKSIRLIDVIDQVDPIDPIETCPLSIEDHGPNLCPLHRLLNKAIQNERRLLSQTRLSDVTRGVSAPTPLCSVAEAMRLQVKDD